MKRCIVFSIVIFFVFVAAGNCMATTLQPEDLENSLSIFHSQQHKDLSTSVTYPNDPPSNWDPKTGPYSILGNWEYSGSGSCQVVGYGNVLIKASNGSLAVTGSGAPGDETITKVREKVTVTLTADQQYTETDESETITNLYVTDNYLKVSNNAGLTEEFFLLSDNTLKIHTYGSMVIGTQSIEDLDIWYSAIRSNEAFSSGSGSSGGCNLQNYPLSLLLLILPLLFMMIKKSDKKDLRKILLLIGIIIIAWSLITPHSSYASSPFNASEKATRSQVMDNVVSAAYGNYFWTGRGNRTPFLPKGFPQWNMSKSEVIDILGKNYEEYELYDTVALHYYKFDVLFNRGKMIGFRFGRQLHGIAEGNFMRIEISEWRRFYPPEKSNYEIKDTDKHRSHKNSFATYRRSNPRYKVIAWVENKGPDNGSYVCLASFAEKIGIID